MNKMYGLYPDDQIVDCGMDCNEVDGNTVYFTDGYYCTLEVSFVPGI